MHFIAGWPESRGGGGGQVPLPLPYRSYATDMLQFPIKDGFKQAGNITKVFSKASSIVSYVKESTIEAYFLESEKC